jgi:predicted Mrr-cat superfamily restriction endonuclease
MMEVTLCAMTLIIKEIQFKQICMEYSSFDLSLVSGLSAFAERSSKEIALVYTGPDDSDMLVAAIVLGLLAPAISFSIASGIGALNTLSYASQDYGLNTGLATR